MSRPALPEERGHDERPEPPTLSELKRSHEWRTEHRDRHEKGDGALPIMICRQCGHERPMERRGRPPDCPVREIPGDAIEYARQHGLIPDSAGARTDSMHGVPSSGFGR